MISTAGASTTRARRRAKMYAQIVEEALAIALEDGLEGLTIAKLAARLDYAPAAIYRYYASKDAIIAAVQTQCIAAMQERITHEVDRLEARATGLSKQAFALLPLVASADLYSRLPEEEPSFHLFAMVVGDPRPIVAEQDAAQVLLAAAPLVDAVTQMFAGAEKAKALKPGDAKRRAINLWASQHGVLMMRKLGRFDPTMKDPRLSSELMRSLLVGWGAKDTVLDEVTDFIAREQKTARKSA